VGFIGRDERIRLKSDGSTGASWDKTVLGVSVGVMSMAVVVIVGWHAHRLTTVMARSESAPLAAPRLVTRHSTRDSEILQKDKIVSSVRIVIAEDGLVNQKVALGQLAHLGYRNRVESRERT